MYFLRNENGAAMALVLTVMLVLTLLGTALWHYGMNETLHASVDEKQKQAYYLARTGAEAAMAAWLEEGVTTKPQGEVERVYYNVDTGKFQNEEPDNSGGYFDVIIERIDEEDSDRYGLTEITSTGVVDDYSHTVTQVTFPFTYGHELSPAWYNPLTGIVPEENFEEFDEAELIVVSADSELTLIGSYGSEYPMLGSFSAETIAFEVPLDIAVENNNKTFTVNAKTVFFYDISLFYLPERSFWTGTRPQREGRLFLKVPDHLEGYEVIGGNTDDNYGRVYFDGKDVQEREYRWEGWGYITASPVHQNDHNITGPNGENLAGNAYYFRDGTNLLDIQEGDLIPMSDDDGRRPIFKDANPYYWE